MRKIRNDSEVSSRPGMRGGGLGSRPKKMYGERLGDGVEFHLMSKLRPVVKYRGVEFHLMRKSTDENYAPSLSTIYDGA